MPQNLLKVCADLTRLLHDSVEDVGLEHLLVKKGKDVKKEDGRANLSKRQIKALHCGVHPLGETCVAKPIRLYFKGEILPDVESCLDSRGKSLAIVKDIGTVTLVGVVDSEPATDVTYPLCLRVILVCYLSMTCMNKYTQAITKQRQKVDGVQRLMSSWILPTSFSPAAAVQPLIGQPPKMPHLVLSVARNELEAFKSWPVPEGVKALSLTAISIEGNVPSAAVPDANEEPPKKKARREDGEDNGPPHDAETCLLLRQAFPCEVEESRDREAKRSLKQEGSNPDAESAQLSLKQAKRQFGHLFK